MHRKGFQTIVLCKKNCHLHSNMQLLIHTQQVLNTGVSSVPKGGQWCLRVADYELYTVGSALLVTTGQVRACNRAQILYITIIGALALLGRT